MNQEKINKKIEKIEKELQILKEQVQGGDVEWVTITEKECPTLSKYGAKPFKIMKRKMRDKDGKVWSDINFYNAKKECEKMGYRLPDIREMLALLEHYTNTQKEISEHDKEFLGIEELSYEEDVCYEWVEGGNNAFLRGGAWAYGAYAGVCALGLYDAPSYADSSFGFRMCKDLL